MLGKSLFKVSELAEESPNDEGKGMKVRAIIGKKATAFALVSICLSLTSCEEPLPSGCYDIGDISLYVDADRIRSSIRFDDGRFREIVLSAAKVTEREGNRPTIVSYPFFGDRDRWGELKVVNQIQVPRSEYGRRAVYSAEALSLGRIDAMTFSSIINSPTEDEFFERAFGPRASGYHVHEEIFTPLSNLPMVYSCMKFDAVSSSGYSAQCNTRFSLGEDVRVLHGVYMMDPKQFLFMADIARDTIRYFEESKEACK